MRPARRKLPSARPRRYSRFAMVVHWSVAVAVFATFTCGWLYQDWLITHPIFAPDLLQWHMVGGVALLVLFGLRLLWRWRTTLPAPPHNLPRRMQQFGGWVHRLLYLLVLLVAVSGWVLASLAAPVVQDSIALPHGYTLATLPLPYGWLQRTEWIETFSILHTTSLWVLAACIALHICAAMFHHVILRDDTLLRITPIRAHGLLHRLRGTRAAGSKH